VTALAHLFWRDGALWSESPGCPPRAWARPADLAQARLGTDPAVGVLELANGRDLLTAAFGVVPFVRGPFPEPTFGEAVTPAARAAFQAFLGLCGAGRAANVSGAPRARHAANVSGAPRARHAANVSGAPRAANVPGAPRAANVPGAPRARHAANVSGDDFRVMRGEPDDFLVFARRAGAAWQVGGFTVEATTLTVRFEDVWDLTPPDLRVTSYAATVLGDSACAIPTILPDLAPDARIFIDLAANGGFLLSLAPAEGAA